MLCGSYDTAALQKWYFCTWGFSCPLVVVLNINTRICVLWKEQTAQKRWQFEVHKSTGITVDTEAAFCRFGSIKRITLFFSFQWRNEAVWVARITWKTLHWHWLDGRYYMKNKLGPGETWQIELWSWPRMGGERDWGKFNDKASISIKSAKCHYCRTSL